MLHSKLIGGLNLEKAFNRELHRAREAGYRKKLREEVLEHYGGSPPRCDCCGETELKFLTLDHMEGNGNSLRRLYGQRSAYTYVRKQGFPSGYRVLCMNCNFSIGHYGFCPHNGGYC